MNVAANRRSFAAALAESERGYAAIRPRSKALYETACEHLPGGSTRSTLAFDPFPFMVARGRGARLVDVDGIELIDFVSDYTAALFGHDEPHIAAAIREALDAGMSFGAPTAHEARLAGLIRARFPSCELIRFCCSGTEANLMAITTARAATGRKEVMVFDGAYHGGVFTFNKPDSPTIAPFPWRFGVFNDLAATLAVIERHAADLAAIVIEPLQGSGGALPADPAFLRGLREAATRHGIVLIFDEVMTSRLGPGGMQARLGIRPDLTALGKYLGGGLDFGAFGGRRDLLAIYDPRQPSAYFVGGTYANNALAMAAGAAGLEHALTPEASIALNARGDRLRLALTSAGAARGLPVQVTGLGSIMNIHVQAKPIAAARDIVMPPTLRKLIHLELIARGYAIARRGMIALSLPLTDADCDGLVAAFADVLDAHAPAIEEALGATPA